MTIKKSYNPIFHISTTLSIAIIFLLGLVFGFSSPSFKVSAASEATSYIDITPSEPLKIDNVQIIYDKSNNKIVGKLLSSFEISLNFKYNAPSQTYILSSANYKMLFYPYRYVYTTDHYIYDSTLASIINNTSTSYWSLNSTITREVKNISFINSSYQYIDFINLEDVFSVVWQFDIPFDSSYYSAVLAPQPGSTQYMYYNPAFNVLNQNNELVGINRAYQSPSNLGISLSTTNYPKLSSNSNACITLITASNKIDNYYLNVLEAKNLFDSAFYRNEGVGQVVDNPQDYGLYNQEMQDFYNTQNYQAGYREGVLATQEDALQYSNIFTTVFNSFSSILDTQIFPGVSLGLVIGFPLLFALVIIILKLVRG